ncbi:MAG: enoyl-CoA hydratase/isomerase family protein [Acidimicrobiales bacterium]|nr:enoyl-CoA hydratase/isomerase family protein [Acidimicrobiales bacterium]
MPESEIVQIATENRIRTLTLNRPEALNAMNQALYDATTNALLAAASDDDVAVVVLTGNGRGFCAGQDLLEMAAQMQPGFERGEHGFPGLLDTLTDFPKPLLLAINGLGLGIGATICGFADLVFMSTEARLKCPFTSLGVAPEAASSELFPRLMGRQHGAWMLLSSEWMSAAECLEMGLAFKVVEPDQLLAVTYEHAAVLASKPVSSLVASKAAITAPWRESIVAARQREDAAFAELMGAPANLEALAAFAEKRDPDFTGL